MSKFCSECGNKLNENEKFCSKCGNKIDSSAKEEKSSQVNNNTKKCKHCKKEIELDAKICPFCRKKQKGSALAIILVIFAIMVIIGIFNSRFGSAGLEIKNSNGKYNELGVAYWEGDLVNTSSFDKENVTLTYTCYNNSRELKGKLETVIKYIKAGETLHFRADGVVKYDENLKCEAKIESYKSHDK